LRLNLPGQAAQIQMSMTVNQGGEQDGLSMIPRRCLKPLSAELLKRSHVKYDSVGHHHRTIFYDWLSYGDNQPGPVQNRTKIRPTRRLGDGETRRLEVYFFSGHMANLRP
jgi:hypothetical protein